MGQLENKSEHQLKEKKRFARYLRSIHPIARLLNSRLCSRETLKRVLHKLRAGRFKRDEEMAALRRLNDSLASSTVCIALENARLCKKTNAAVEHERDMRRWFLKFVPKEALDAIIRGVKNGRAVVEEVKTVTLLTIDIRGFSRMAKQMGPRRTVALLNRFFAVTAEVVFRHHGMVDKYLGDGFLAVFGAPVSTGDDAGNAVQSALEMRTGLVQMNRCLKLDFETTLQMGISIHTGEVVVGNIGCETKMDYTVIGDAVNTVFRMQRLGKTFPNGILISGTTLEAVRPRPRVYKVDLPRPLRRDLGELAVYELRGGRTAAAERRVAAHSQSDRCGSRSNGRQTPSPVLPPPVLSP